MSLMASMAQQKHLELEVLSKDVQKVLIECGKRLESAPFKDNGKFEFIDERIMLGEASRDFVKAISIKVRTWARSLIDVSNSKQTDCRLIA